MSNQDFQQLLKIVSFCFPGMNSMWSNDRDDSGLMRWIAYIKGSVVDPDPHGSALNWIGIKIRTHRECRIGYRGKESDWNYKETIIFVCHTYYVFMFNDLPYIGEYLYFSWKNLSFCDGIVWPGSISARIRVSLAPWICGSPTLIKGWGVSN
jgi:hypothetical protein